MSLAAAVILTILNLLNLPETVPTHFDAAGNPDDHGSRNVLWIIPVIALIAYAGLTWLSGNPGSLSYPVRITDTNASVQYRNSVLMLRVMKSVVLGQLTSLIFFQRQVSIGALDKLPGWWLPVSVACTIGTIVWFLFRSIQLR